MTMSAKFRKRFEEGFLVNHTTGFRIIYKVSTTYDRKSESSFKKWVKRHLEVVNVNDLPKVSQQQDTRKADTTVAKERRKIANLVTKILAIIRALCMSCLLFDVTTLLG